MARGAAFRSSARHGSGQRLSRLLMLRGKVFSHGGIFSSELGPVRTATGFERAPKRDGVVSRRFAFGTS